MSIDVGEGENINGLLFKADSSKGLIFFLHGNSGSLDSWGKISKTYTDLQYDLFILDYPGYGKSSGSIKGQAALYEDLQIVYNEIKKRYTEDQTVILGYSIGTGPAAYLASKNHPKLLILQAPYFSLTDMMRRKYPIVPTFILNYSFNTSDYLKNCNMPIVIFHGDRDGVINFESSLKLKDNFKTQDTLIPLKGLGHNGFTDNEVYLSSLKKILTP